MRTVRWAIAGPGVLAAWLAVTVGGPLLSFELTHRWEEDQGATSAAWWAVASSPLVAAVTAAAAARRGRTSPVAVLLQATAVGWVLLAAALAGWTWVIPLDGSLDAAPVAACAAAATVVGAALGYAVGARMPASSGRAHRTRGYVLGAVVTLFGVLLTPTLVRLGAEDSTLPYTDDGHYSKADGAVVLPAAGRYAILGVGDAPARPDCRITGGGVTGRRADVVTVAPADYGGDVATLAWVATFTAPGPGTYGLSCRGDGTYVVGDVPRIRGAVGSLIHWPLVLLLLLGAVPGLAITVAHIGGRRSSA